MTSPAALIDLRHATDRRRAGGKAAVLAELGAAGFAVPPGFVVTAAALDDPGFDAAVGRAARRLPAGRFAVRSSAQSEDLPGASYAGLYETFLDVPADGLAAAIRRCFAAAGGDRVRAYQDHRPGSAGMAVLVQTMVDAVSAGVAFTADPVTGDRQRTVVTAVAGLGERLVSGDADGELWTVAAGAAPSLTRSGADAVLAGEQAAAVASLARRVEDRCRRPQDVEWAIDRAGELWLLQARPMTALPDPVTWAPPGPGLWMRNFRLGEWLPEAVTPLFATWLLPALEDGYLDGMSDSIGVRVPFRYAIVNGWYYNATPLLNPRLLGSALGAARILYHALFNVSRDPAGADRAVLAGLHRAWRDEQAPRYRRCVTAAAAEAATARPERLMHLIDAMAREAGIALWYLAIVGGSAWKMEGCLTRFTRRHLAQVIPRDGGVHTLLSGLPGAVADVPGHAVYTLDWYHPTAGELHDTPPGAGPRTTSLAARREDAERRCTEALAGRPRLLAEFQRLLRVNQRYAVIREAQARELTLAWPVLRAGVLRLGEHLGHSADDIFFRTRDEVRDAVAGAPGSPADVVTKRRARWQRQRRLVAPLTLGRPPRLVGDVIERAVTQARGPITGTGDVLVGHPASAGRATGVVRVLDDAAQFASFADGEVLVAKATAPAWTPLFGRAAAVVTDTGTLAAHASLIAREYGIPAVVGTGDATHRLHTGQVVTVDGSAGTVTTRRT
ncbi:PEP/pyruvate-binding domain-containing protein [Actinoplanes aureus]|uniref:Phosphoenolpyruvate synthase n=1 Tax=Actinoplanes aureus TaxID=2792083 RepID=A0A931FVI7_9ACTN|nr:PEP/pyruvate-binding domain-containing protein [Actinoplanes aureus]MBG0561358.1 hypothetical protein [Actinoplanes aureus]